MEVEGYAVGAAAVLGVAASAAAAFVVDTGEHFGWSGGGGGCRFEGSSCCRC